MTKSFGGIRAVDDLSLGLDEEVICGIIGPNGSGKTTLFNLVTGVLRADSGTVYFKGERIDRLKPFQVAQKGIGRTFQIVKLFPKLTVMQNMLVPPHPPKAEKRAIELLKFVGLVDLKDEYGSNLSYGQQKLIQFAIALMPDPDLILLDEPVSGINPVMIEQLTDYIREFRREGKGFLIVEHNMPFVMGICEKVIVLNMGQKIAEGPAERIQADKKVIDAYLGEA